MVLRLVAIVMLASVAGAVEGRAGGSAPPEANRRLTAGYGKLPLHFEANLGQTGEPVRFLARGSGYGLFLTATESVLVLRRTESAGTPAVLRLRLLGAAPLPVVEGKDAQAGKSHYFVGNDPKKWRTNVPHYARVEYKDVYPGISLSYYGNQSQLEYDFVVSPGGDPSRIRLGIEGAEEIRIDAAGALVLGLPGGEVIQKAPVVYQEIGGARKPVDGRFVITGRNEVGFEVGAYDAEQALVLDPLLVYSTYLGGSSNDFGSSIAVDAAGNAYVMGSTASLGFPTASPLQPAYGGGGYDVFVAKLNAAGSALVYSTYLGGSGEDIGVGIALDGAGGVYLAGSTDSTDFPTANAFQPAYGGGTADAFVAKLDPAGSALVYATYLGGGGDDEGFRIAVDAAGSAYLTGFTDSTDFPTANPLQATYGGGIDDAFVAKLNAAGTGLVYSTYLGGQGDDEGFGIAVDVSGNALVTGDTDSSDFPTANPFQAAKGGDHDAYVAKLNAAGSALVYATYLGGNAFDGGTGIAVDGAGNAYVTGYTQSPDFPTASPFQAAYGGGLDDAFVAKLNAAGGAVYSTYLGGSGGDRGVGIAVDGSGSASVTGETYSDNFPAAHAFQGAYGGGGYDAFVAKLNAPGSALVYSSYLGGNGSDHGSDVAVDASGSAYVVGETNSTSLPTVDPLQPASAGGYDAFVARIGLFADLSISATDGQPAAAAGSPVTYTIVVVNGGPDAVTGATVVDAFPAGLTGITWTCSTSGGSSCGVTSGSGNINETASLLAGGTATFTATGVLDINASGTLSNTATVTPPAEIADPDPTDNSATDVDTIVPAADLSITKTDGQSAVSPGQVVTYSIVAGNAGPAAVNGAIVLDAVPAALVAPSWTCTGASGGTCTAAGTGSVDDRVTLPMGASVTYTVSGTVSPSASGLSNTATVTAPNTVFDPNPANNTATDTDLVTCGSVRVVVPDGRDTDVPVAAGETVWIGAMVRVGNSYSLELESAAGSRPPGTLTVFKGDDSCNGTSTLTTHDTSAIDPSGNGGVVRASFVAAGTERFYQARLENTTGAPGTLRVGWSETSLFSPAWSTNGSFDTYYSLENTTGADLGGRLTLLDRTGVVQATVDLSIPAGQTVGTNTASLGVTRNLIGTAKLTHTGPPRSIVVEAAIANFALSPAYVQPVKFQAVREGR